MSEDLTRVGDMTLIRSLDEWRRYTVGMPPHLKELPARIVRNETDCECFFVRTVKVFGPSNADEEAHIIVTMPDAAVLVMAVHAKVLPMLPPAEPWRPPTKPRKN